MDVLIVSKSDWANMGYRFQESLRKVGVDAKATAISINYSCKPNHAEVCKLEKMRKYARSAKIIQFMHSEFFDLGIKDKRLFVFHGGGRYRDNSSDRNNLFNSIVEKCIIQSLDLWGRGAKNQVWVLPPVDSNIIKPIYNKHNNIVIGHFPSSSKGKGSDLIQSVIDRLSKDKFEYIFSDQRVSWNKQIKRMSRCDIYIEQMLVGAWGITALEAAALGKIVVTNFKNYKTYTKEYGVKSQIQPANSETELENILVKLLSMTDEELLELKRKTRTWVEEHHSYEAVGKRLKEVVYEI